MRVVALALGGVISGLSAARVGGWSLKREPTEIEVTLALCVADSALRDGCDG